MKIIGLIGICLGTILSVFGQPKEITKAEYYKVYREAYKMFYDTPSRRESSKIEYYTDGKLNRTMEAITENLKPDKWRFIVIETSDKGKDRSDLIRIGENYFCRRNDGEWKNSKAGCNQGWISGLSNVIKSQFFVETFEEKGKTYKVYKEYTLYKKTLSNDQSKEEISYWESKFWLNGNSSVFRQGNENGSTETKQIYSKEIRSYDYNPKDLKIEAPIIETNRKPL